MSKIKKEKPDDYDVYTKLMFGKPSDLETLKIQFIKDNPEYKEKEKLYFSNFNDIWIIGGSSVYQDFIKYDMTKIIQISKYYITYIDKDYDCDTYFPLLENMNKYYYQHKFLIHKSAYV